MTLKEKYTQFDKTAPLRTARLTHGSFTYRYYKNSQIPSGNITLVFLAGGTGLGDSLFYLYDSLLPKYSLITFNYPMDFPTMFPFAMPWLNCSNKSAPGIST